GPLHARSRGPLCPAPFAWLSRCARSPTRGLRVLAGGLRPAGPPTRSLAGAPLPRAVRVALSLRSFANTGASRISRGASPRRTPHTLTRGGPSAPRRSRGSLAALVRQHGGFAY